MSGKVRVAVVAAALGCASAAIVGVVYKMAGPQHGAAQTSVGETVAISAAGKTAVVLNASQSVQPFADSSADDAEAPACPSGADGKRCVVVARAYQTPFRILGLTVSIPIPPLWLGRDSEDRYGEDRLALLTTYDPAWRSDVSPGRLWGAENSDSQSQSESNDSQSQSDSPTFSQLGSFDPSDPGSIVPSLFASLPGVDPAVSPITGDQGSDPAVAPNTGDQGSGRDQGSNPVSPITGDQGSGPGALSCPPWAPPCWQSPYVPAPFDVTGRVSRAVPEPSTWLMMLAGAAFIGALKRRRIAAIFTSARG
ncbi:MAG TPA: PEPxxWA-CTERM sorting domain-containing protein [Roseiarcus sp.]|nr:PEPxxWA-CTERM sorting domain-containing protein [Roseiarcus sp.]